MGTHILLADDSAADVLHKHHLELTTRLWGQLRWLLAQASWEQCPASWALFHISPSGRLEAAGFQPDMWYGSNHYLK